MQPAEEGPAAAEGGRRPAAQPLPASTVVLVRPAQQGREVLLLRRPPSSAFAPDAWVFPGGRLDESDREFPAALWSGPSPSDWAQQLSLPDPYDAAAYVVAAVREAWEETGILLVSGGMPDGCARARQEVLAGTRTLAEYLQSEPLKLAADRLTYVAHWITPDWLPRRFDTRFFLAQVGSEARCELQGDELVEFRWQRPEVALAAAEAGDLHLLPPTVDTLRRLSRGEI